MTDDGRLLRQYTQGSQAAFSALVARHLNFVYSVCLRETGDAALAEDAAQVVFLLLARKAPALRPGSPLTGWLFTTARFAAKNARRREARRRQWEAQALEQTPTPDQDDAALWDQVRPALNDALAALGAKDRAAVLLRFADGLSFPELGVALGTSEDAARMRLNRAIDRLRRFFASQGTALSGAGLAALLADKAVQSAPLRLADVLSQTLLGLDVGTQTLLLYKGALKTMQMMKLKVAALLCGAGLVIIVTGVGIVKTTALPNAVRVANPKALKPVPTMKGAKRTHMNTPATIVQSYLDACNAKKYEEAYQLLSPATQQLMPLSLFRQVKQMPADPTADGMTPTLTAVSAFFIDRPNPAGYHYTVVGASPDDPSVVLVQAQPPVKVSKDALSLKIATSDGPSQAGQPMIDMMKSMQASDAVGVKKATRWAEDRTKKSR